MLCLFAHVARMHATVHYFRINDMSSVLEYLLMKRSIKQFRPVTIRPKITAITRVTVDMLRIKTSFL
jgi:hypothetical protein